MKTKLATILGVLACGCGGGGGPTGSLQVFVVAEDTVTNGLVPGTELENIQDGWTVTYQKFLVAVGSFHASSSTDASKKVTDPRVFVVDMKAIGENGLVIAEFRNNIAAARFDKVGYDVPRATSAAIKATGTSQADYDLMVSKGYSLYFEATMTNPTGQSCNPTNPSQCQPATQIVFKWGLAGGTSYDNCGSGEGDSGFAVPTGGTVAVKPTIHGDHWFFSGIPHGSVEITTRLAQWIANADLNHDGETTMDEIRSIAASDLFPAATYDLSGGLVTVTNGYDFFEAEARSLGHFNGDGDCELRSKIN